MPTALYRLILSCLMLLPLAVFADDASDFAAANNSQQAQLLESWAAQPVPARVELINSLQQGQVTVDGQVKTLRLNNRLRGLIDTALASHQLLASDPKLRLSAAQQLQKSAKPAQLHFLDRQLVDETDSDVHSALSLALANLQLVDPDPAVRLAAVRLLGETGEPLARTRLENLLQPGVEADAGVRTAASEIVDVLSEQRLAAEQIAQNTERMAQMIERGARAASASSASADQVATLADQLRASTLQFSV